MRDMEVLNGKAWESLLIPQIEGLPGRVTHVSIVGALDSDLGRRITNSNGLTRMTTRRVILPLQQCLRRRRHRTRLSYATFSY